MTDWRHVRDAPEKVKYHGGYDPADPPLDEDPSEAEMEHWKRMLEHARKWKATNEYQA